MSKSSFIYETLAANEKYFYQYPFKYAQLVCVYFHTGGINQLASTRIKSISRLDHLKHSPTARRGGSKDLYKMDSTSAWQSLQQCEGQPVHLVWASL